MKSLLALFLLGAAASPAVGTESPCYRDLGAVHLPELLSASPSEPPSELQIQTRCLVLENSVFPKAEFIPPAVGLRPAGPRVFRITVVETGDERRARLERSERPSFGLGAPATVLGPVR